VAQRVNQLSPPGESSTGPHYDFSQVRIHSDHKAAESARALGAKAYTVSNSVVFGEGQYASDSPAGRRLLAHELTHVVQQNGIKGDAASTQSVSENHIQRAISPTRTSYPGENW